MLVLSRGPMLEVVCGSELCQMMAVILATALGWIQKQRVWCADLALKDFLFAFLSQKLEAQVLVNYLLKRTIYYLLKIYFMCMNVFACV